MGSLKYREIKTERLLLRTPKAEDYQRHFEYLSDKNNFIFADYIIATSIDDSVAFMERQMRDQLKSSLFWIISDKQTNISIGTISAWNVDFDRNSIEFGYSIYPKYRQNGYMRETLIAMIDYCFLELGFSIIDIWTDKNNHPSRLLAERLGFVFMGYEEEKAKYSPGNILYAKYQLNFQPKSN